MINEVARLLEYLLGEGGGVCVDITEPIEDSKPEITDEDEDEDDKSEELYSQHVENGKLVTKRNEFGAHKREPMTNVKDNANLIKARIRAQTPQANFKRKHSMDVRRRKIDGNR